MTQIFINYSYSYWVDLINTCDIFYRLKRIYNLRMIAYKFNKHNKIKKLINYIISYHSEILLFQTFFYYYHAN